MPGESDTLIVYLILVHGDPELLARMVGALDNDRVRFFIHVDAKNDIGHFKTNIPMKDRCTFITDRVEVYWGGFSMVEAILRLMKAAINDVPDFKYAVLLSGAHYPIKTNDYILSMLQDSSSEYLQYAKVSEIGCEFKINAFCFFDYKLFNPRTVYFSNRRLNRIMRMPGKLADIFFRRLVPVVYKKKLDSSTVPYVGANWWVLTKPCVQYVLKYIEEKRYYKKFFRFAIQPDETFFHTIICNSHFKLANQDVTLDTLMGNAPMNEKYSQLRGLNLTLQCSIDGSPRTLDEDDFPKISKELNYFGFPQLFARKFNTELSHKLLHLIDNFRKTRPD